MKKAAWADFSRKKEKKRKGKICVQLMHIHFKVLFRRSRSEMLPPPTIFGKSSDDNLFFHLFLEGGGKRSLSEFLAVISGGERGGEEEEERKLIPWMSVHPFPQEKEKGEKGKSPPGA